MEGEKFISTTKKNKMNRTFDDFSKQITPFRQSSGTKKKISIFFSRSDVNCWELFHDLSSISMQKLQNLSLEVRFSAGIKLGKYFLRKLKYEQRFR